MMLEGEPMVDQIYDQLKSPKTIEELNQRLSEVGLKWSKSQIELFLKMDKNVLKNGDFYSVGVTNIKDIILDIIDKAIGEKPVIPIKKVMENIPQDIIVSVEELSKVALNSGKYTSPNDLVLKKVK